MTKSSRGRLRVFFAEFDGDDETIQAGLSAITAAVNKTFQPQRVVKLISSIDANGEGDEDVIEGEIVEQSEEELMEVTGAQKMSRSKTKRKPPTMTIVKDLDLRPDDKPHFRQFVDEKQPNSQMEKVCVSVYYLSRILEIDGITANHVYTCFGDAKWRVPKDLPQIIRNTAAKFGWVDTSDSQDIKSTTSGENFVKHDLPRKRGNGEK